MPDLRDLLRGADDEALQQLVGRETVRLLDLLDPRATRPSRLRQIIIDSRGTAELIDQDASRRVLLSLLDEPTRKSVAEKLVDGRGATPDLPLWKQPGVKRVLRDLLITTPPSDERTPTPDTESVTADYQLFPHQRQAVGEIEAIFSSERRRAVLHMPTGSGKTRTAMHAICYHLASRDRGVVVWLAFSEELCEQALQEFTRAWRTLGNRELATVRYFSEFTPALDHDDAFIVMGLSKAYRAVTRSIEPMAILGDRVSLVIFDEAHQATAETYRTVTEVLTEKQPDVALLGLTATPGRTWNRPDEDRELADMFYGQKVTLRAEGFDSPVEFLINQGYLARPRFVDLSYEREDENDSEVPRNDVGFLDISTAVLNALGEDEFRNLAILQRAETLRSDHSRILLFAPSVASARLLATALQVRNHDAMCVDSHTPLSRRKAILERYQSDSPEPMILCNFGVLTTGFDAPSTSAAILARPTRSLVLYSQMVGRALRGPRAGGNETATIVTVVDQNVPGFRDLSETFFNWEDVW